MTPDEMMKEGDKLYNQGSPGGAREWYVGAFAKLGIIAGNQLEALEKRNAELSAALHDADITVKNAGSEIMRLNDELERVKAQVPRWVRVEGFKADESKLQFAWMAHKGRAYITMVKPHPELDGFAIVTHEADYTDMPDGYIALIPAPIPASSGPEQPKCGGLGFIENLNTHSNAGVRRSRRCSGCPDCAKDRAEPEAKYVAEVEAEYLRLAGKPLGLAPQDSMFAWIREFWHGGLTARDAAIEVKLKMKSRHCHTPAPAAKEVMPRSD